MRIVEGGIDMNIYISAYRAIEHIDGEKGPIIMPYKMAERIKLWLLNHIA